jgi:hypothetical protein
MCSIWIDTFLHAGCTVYTNLDGRSTAAHQRALEAGKINVPLDALLSKSNWILSIGPPGEAFASAQKIRRVLAGSPLAGLALHFHTLSSIVAL